MLLFSIDNLGFEIDEVKREKAKFIVEKNVEVQPNTEFDLGKSAQFCKLSYISTKPIYKYDFKLSINKEKLRGLERLYGYQHERKANFNCETGNVLADVLFSFSSTLSSFDGGESCCLIDKYVIVNSFVNFNEIYYDVSLSLFEVCQE